MSSIVNRRFLFVSLVTLLVMAPGTVALWPAIDEQTPCQKARAWVAHATQLPQDYDDIVALPLEYRKAIFAALPTTVKVQLWQEQLRRVVETSALADGERQFIEEVIADLTPESYAQHQLPEPKSIKLALAARKDLWSAFTRLGPETGSFLSPRAIVLNLQDTLRRLVVARAFDSCGCSDESDWCDIISCDPGAPACHQFFCEVSMGGGCDYENSGCGTLWSYPCNGRCAYYPWATSGVRPIRST